MVKQRINWARNYTPEQKQRINNNQCPNCGKPKEEWTRRTDWTCCSKGCSDGFYGSLAVLDWQRVRRKAFKRDNYTCQWCGKQPMWEPFGVKKPDDSQLIADHIVPIAIGGKEFDIDNVQTLCIQCNKIKTKRDARIIAKHRRREKELKYDIDMMEVRFPIQTELKGF